MRNLLPEGWLADQVLGVEIQGDSSQRQNRYISGGLKFLSNFVITKKGEEHPQMDLDFKLDSLANHIDGRGRFVGKKGELAGSSGDPEFTAKVAEYWKDRHTARYSGAELKTPQCLSANGQLQPAVSGAPFNVFLKYAGRDGMDSLGINEFMGLSMAKAVGLETPAFCVIEQPDGLPPIFAIERYDIPHGMPDQTSNRFITQDFVTLLGVKPNEKGIGSVEKIGKCMRAVSDEINPEKTQENLEKLFTRAFLSWVVNDRDMHMKNISMLKEYRPQDGKYVSAVFSPSYDITSDINDERMNRGAQVLNISGSTNNLKLAHFLNLAMSLNVYGKDKEKITAVMKDIAEKAALKAIEIYKDPPIKNLSEDIRYDMAVIVSHTVDRARVFDVKGLDWNSDDVWKDYNKKSARARVKQGERFSATAKKRRELMLEGYM